jgi:hypothetical protein
MKNNIEFTKEMGGTLLVIINGNTYEVSRCNSFLYIETDKGDIGPTFEQREILKELFIKSNCATR